MKASHLKIIAVLLVLGVFTAIIFRSQVASNDEVHSHDIWHIKGTSFQTLTRGGNNYILSHIETASGRKSDSIFILQSLIEIDTTEYIFDPSLCLDTVPYKLCFLNKHLDVHGH